MEVDEMWIESHNGEYYGEAIFRRVAEGQSDPVRRTELGALAQLEEATRALTASVVARRGLDLGDVTGDARETAAAVASKSWPEFLDWLQRVTDHYLDNYYRPLVAASTDPEERRVAAALVQHEEALATYGRRAAGQETGDPLQAVYACPHMTAPEAAR